MESFIFNNFKERFLRGEVAASDTWYAYPVNSNFEDYFDNDNVKISQFRNIEEMRIYADQHDKNFNDSISKLAIYNYEYVRKADEKLYSDNNDKPYWVSLTEWSNTFKNYIESTISKEAAEHIHELIFSNRPVLSSQTNNHDISGFYWVVTINELLWLADRVNGDLNGEKTDTYNNHINIVLGDSLGKIGSEEQTIVNKLFVPIGKYSDRPYEGVFFGNGYSIGGIIIECNNNDNGIFGTIGNNGIVDSLKIHGTIVLDNKKKISISHIKTDGSDVYTGIICGRNYGTITNAVITPGSVIKIKNFIPEVYPTRNKTENATIAINEISNSEVNKYWPNYMCIDNPGNIIPYCGYFNEGLIGSIFKPKYGSTFECNYDEVTKQSKFVSYKSWNDVEFESLPYYNHSYNMPFQNTEYVAYANITGHSACCLLYNWDEICYVDKEYKKLNNNYKTDFYTETDSYYPNNYYNQFSFSGMGLMSYCGPLLSKPILNSDDKNACEEIVIEENEQGDTFTYAITDRFKYAYYNEPNMIFKNVYDIYPLKTSYLIKNNEIKQDLKYGLPANTPIYLQFKNYLLHDPVHTDVFLDGWNKPGIYAPIYDLADQLAFEKQQYECPWMNKPTKMSQYSRAAYYIGSLAGWNGNIIEKSSVECKVYFDGTFVGFYGGLVGKQVRGKIDNVLVNVNVNDNVNEATLDNCRKIVEYMGDEGKIVDEQFNLYFDQWPTLSKMLYSGLNVIPKADVDINTDPFFTDVRNITNGQSSKMYSTLLKAIGPSSVEDIQRYDQSHGLYYRSNGNGEVIDYVWTHDLTRTSEDLYKDIKTKQDNSKYYRLYEYFDATADVVRKTDARYINTIFDFSKINKINNDYFAHNLGLNLNQLEWYTWKQACEYEVSDDKDLYDENVLEEILKRIEKDFDTATNGNQIDYELRNIEIKDDSTPYHKAGVQEGGNLIFQGHQLAVTSAYKRPALDAKGSKCQAPWPYGITLLNEWNSYINETNKIIFNGDVTVGTDDFGEECYVYEKGIDFALPEMITAIINGYLDADVVDQDECYNSTQTINEWSSSANVGTIVMPFSAIDLADAIPFGEIDDLVNPDSRRAVDEFICRYWMNELTEEEIEHPYKACTYGARYGQYICARQTPEEVENFSFYKDKESDEIDETKKITLTETSKKILKKILTPKMHVNKIYFKEIYEGSNVNGDMTTIFGKNFKIVKLEGITIKNILNLQFPLQSKNPNCRWDTNSIRFMFGRYSLDDININRIYNIRTKDDEYTLTNNDDPSLNTIKKCEDSTIGIHINLGYNVNCNNFNYKLLSIYNIGGLAGSLVYNKMDIQDTKVKLSNQIRMYFDNKVDNTFDIETLHPTDFNLLNRFGTLAAIMELNSNSISDIDTKTYNRMLKFNNIMLKYVEPDTINSDSNNYKIIGPMHAHNTFSLGIASPIIAEVKPTYLSVPSILSYNNSWLSKYSYGDAFYWSVAGEELTMNRIHKMMTSYGDQIYGLYTHELFPIFDNWNQFGWTYDLNCDMPIQNVYDWQATGTYNNTDSSNLRQVTGNMLLPGLYDYLKYSDKNRTDVWLWNISLNVYKHNLDAVDIMASEKFYNRYRSLYYMFDANPLYLMTKLFDWSAFTIYDCNYGSVDVKYNNKHVDITSYEYNRGPGFGYSKDPVECIFIPYDAVHNRYKLRKDSYISNDIKYDSPRDPAFVDQSETFKFSKQSNTYNIFGSSLEIVKNDTMEGFVRNHVVRTKSCDSLNEAYKKNGITDVNYVKPTIINAITQADMNEADIFKNDSIIEYNPNNQNNQDSSDDNTELANDDIYYYSRIRNKIMPELSYLNNDRVELNVKFGDDIKYNDKQEQESIYGYWLYDNLSGYSGHNFYYNNNILHIGNTMSPKNIRELISLKENNTSLHEAYENSLIDQFNNDLINEDDVRNSLYALCNNDVLSTFGGAYTSAFSAKDFQGLYITDSNGYNIMYIDTHVGDADGLQSYAMELYKHSVSACGLLLEVK